jgi:hypothetical protein
MTLVILWFGMERGKVWHGGESAGTTCAAAKSQQLREVTSRR